MREVETGRAAEREFPVQDRRKLPGAVRTPPKQQIGAVAIAMDEARRPRPWRDFFAFPLDEFAERRHQLRPEPCGTVTTRKRVIQVCQQPVAVEIDRADDLQVGAQKSEPLVFRRVHVCQRRAEGSPGRAQVFARKRQRVETAALDPAQDRIGMAGDRIVFRGMEQLGDRNAWSELADQRRLFEPLGSVALVDAQQQRSRLGPRHDFEIGVDEAAAHPLEASDGGAGKNRSQQLCQCGAIERDLGAVALPALPHVRSRARRINAAGGRTRMGAGSCARADS